MFEGFGLCGRIRGQRVELLTNTLTVNIRVPLLVALTLLTDLRGVPPAPIFQTSTEESAGSCSEAGTIPVFITEAQGQVDEPLD